jgi:hypothetical protein
MADLPPVRPCWNVRFAVGNQWRLNRLFKAACLRISSAASWARSAALGSGFRQIEAHDGERFFQVKCFLLYTNLRSGCPLGYAVAGIKAISICHKEGKSLNLRDECHKVGSFFLRDIAITINSDHQS